MKVIKHETFDINIPANTHVDVDVRLQSEPKTFIFGIVKDSQGHPKSHAAVALLYEVDGELTCSTVQMTDGDGFYIFPVDDLGQKYSVKVNAMYDEKEPHPRDEAKS